MSLTLWRYELAGPVLASYRTAVRFGRKQNALMVVREATTNNFKAPFFDFDGKDWTADAGLTKVSRQPSDLPFGHGSIELGRTDGLTTTKYLLQSPAIGIFDVNALPNGTRAGYMTVRAKGPVGAQFVMHYDHPAVAPNGAYSTDVVFTITTSGWQRYSARIVPTTAVASANLGRVGYGLTGTFLGPVQLTAASWSWNVTQDPHFVALDMGGQTSIGNNYQTSNSGTAFGTNAYGLMTPDSLQPRGAVSYWVYHNDPVAGRPEYHWAVQDRNLWVDSGTPYPIVASWLQDNTLNVRSYLPYSNTAEVTGTFDVTGITWKQQWHHVLWSWDESNIWRLYIDGEPLAGSATLLPRNTPRAMLFGSDTQNGDSNQMVGFLEGFALYKRSMSAQDALALYRAGDNLQTDTVGYLSCHDGQAQWEIGEAVGFMDIGDYRVDESGYAPGTSQGQPTVRFEGGQFGEGPYIVQGRYPKVIENLNFSVRKDDRPDQTVAQKISRLNDLLVRSSTEQTLVMSYSPQKANRNLRSKVSQAHLLIPNTFTGVAQVANTIKGVRIDLEREPMFSGARRNFATITVPRPKWVGTLAQPAGQAVGALVLPPVEGNAPALMTYAERNAANVPNSFILGIRRRNYLDKPLYVLDAASNSQGIEFLFNPDAAVITDTTRFRASYVRWSEATILGGTETLLATFQSQDFPEIDSQANWGNYRVFGWARVNSATAGLTMRVQIGDVSSTVDVPYTTTNWPMLDFGVMNIPGKSVVRPQLQWWYTTTLQVYVQRSSTSGTFQFGLEGFILVPADDGYASIFTNVPNGTGLGQVTVIDSGANIAQPSLISGFAAGLQLSAREKTELRAMVLNYFTDSGGAPQYDHYDVDSTAYIDYVPQYSGLGDES